MERVEKVAKFLLNFCQLTLSTHDSCSFMKCAVQEAVTAIGAQEGHY
jgi:hypothetical protein